MSIELKVYTNDLHSLTGEVINFENISTEVALTSAYLWDVGDGTAIKTVSSTNSSLVSASYSSTGTYSVLLTAISGDGAVTSRRFSNIIDVYHSYPEYDADIVRVYGSANIAYPYQFDDIMIKPNEWGDKDNINSAFDKLSDNIEYLKDAAKKYIEPPTKYYGWLGQSSVSAESDISWHVLIQGISSQYNHPQNAGDNVRGMNDIRDVSVYNDKIYAMTSTELFILSSDHEASEIDTRSIKTIGDLFFDLNSIEINSTGQIYVLDTAVQRVVVFDNYETYGWKFLYSWGNYGGPNTFKGFKNPVDLHIDSNDDIWVTDEGNNVVKKYTKTGSWLQTIAHKDLRDLVGTAVDNDGNVHVLMKRGCIKFNSAGEFVSSYNVTPPNQSAKRIINSADGFMYIVFSTSIVKITIDGVFGGSFGDTFTDISYSGATQDSKRNIYVTNTNNILKFFDRVTIESVITETGVSEWPMSDIHIDKNEYQEDWVANRSISRMYDNIEVARRSLTGVIYETTDAQGKIKNLVRGFTPTEYSTLFSLKDKSEIFIGINELVTNSSVNRCLSDLYNILETMLNIISGESD